MKANARVMEESERKRARGSYPIWLKLRCGNENCEKCAGYGEGEASQCGSRVLHYTKDDRVEYDVYDWIRTNDRKC